jgi:glycine hydroxymethyltransferase
MGGARSGLILGRQQFAKAVNSAVFPGTQGGPAPCRRWRPRRSRSRSRRRRSSPNASAARIWARFIANRLLGADVARAGVGVVTGGTDVHLVLVGLRDSRLDGKAAEDLLHDIGITSTATPCRTTHARRWSCRACGSARSRWPPVASAMQSLPRVAGVIATALTQAADVPPLRALARRLAREFPLYEGLEEWGLQGR